MKIEKAQLENIDEISFFDRHIPRERLESCIKNNMVYVLFDSEIRGVLRYSLFWQTIPFLDLIFLDESYRDKGYGSEMMKEWETEMKQNGYKYVMTSTQADEDSWKFYKKLGYHKVGGFFPPEQEAEELIYLKSLKP